VSGSAARRGFRGPVLAAVIGVALLVSACTGPGAARGGGESAGATARIHRLASIGTLREAFNADKGATRLVLLISPT
jgi:hypothetical protein